MLKMLKLCEKYAVETNLHFSSNSDPDKSKIRYIYMNGDTTKQFYNYANTCVKLIWVVDKAYWTIFWLEDF